MASLADSIPVDLMRSGAKFQVIEFIRKQRLPQRFARKLLQDWAEAVFVDLNATDYELVYKTDAQLGRG